MRLVWLESTHIEISVEVLGDLRHLFVGKVSVQAIEGFIGRMDAQLVEQPSFLLSLGLLKILAHRESFLQRLLRHEQDIVFLLQDTDPHHVLAKIGLQEFLISVPLKPTTRDVNLLAHVE